jgi:hypothetical protein
MDEHPRATENVVDLLNFAISDEELEKAAGGTTCAHSYPGTGVATICVPDSPFPKKLSTQGAQPRCRVSHLLAVTFLAGCGGSFFWLRLRPSHTLRFAAKLPKLLGRKD